MCRDLNNKLISIQPEKKRNINFIYYLLPLTFIVPPIMSVGGVRINAYELWLAMVFFTGWKSGANHLVFLLLCVCFSTAFTTLVAASNIDVSPGLANFALFKYCISYVAALQLGLRINKDGIEKPRFIAILSLLFLVAITISAVMSHEVRLKIASIYQVNEMVDLIRLRLISSNPIGIGACVIIFWFFASKYKSFLIRLIVYFVSVVPIFLAQQRASLILITVGLIITECSFKIKTVLKILFAVILIGVLIGNISNNEIFLKYRERFSVDRVAKGAQGRAVFFETAWNGFVDEPLFGIGRIEELRNHDDRVEPHNQYVGIIYESGLVGSIPFAVLTMIILIRAYRQYIRGKDDEYNRALFASVIVYFVAMLTWECLYFPPISIFFFLVVGIIYSQENTMPDYNNKRGMIGNNLYSLYQLKKMI
jgi:O-antigen ligase